MPADPDSTLDGVELRNVCPVIRFCRNADAWCSCCIGSVEPDQWADLNDTDPMLHYRKNAATAPRHPYQLWKHQQGLRAKRNERQTKEVRDRKVRTRRAYSNERSTRTQLVRATVRSGAAFGDGDTRIGAGQWGIDDKLQSHAREQITVRVSEVDKASRQRCVIVLTTAEGRKFVVARLEDFAEAGAYLLESQESEWAQSASRVPPRAQGE